MDFNFLKPTLQPEASEPEAQATSYSEEPVTEESIVHSDEVPFRDRYASIIRWTLTLGVFLMPLFFLPWTSAVLEMNKQMLLLVTAGIGLIAWLLSLVSTGRLTWRGSVFDKAILAILTATVVATVFSMARFNSLFGAGGDVSFSLMSVVALAIIYFLIVNTVDDQGQCLTTVFKVALVIALVYGLLQFVGLPVLKYLRLPALDFTLSRAFNTVGSVNALGVLAAACLPFYIHRRPGRLTAAVDSIGLAGALAILVILNWWVLWVVAIAGLVAFIIAESIIREGFSITRFVLPMSIIVIGTFLLVVGLNFRIVRKNLPVEIVPSFSLSGQVVKSVLRENPVTGYGPAGFSMAFDRYGAKAISGSSLSNARFFNGTSAAVNVAVNGGILMLVALAIMAWSLVQASLYYIRHRRIIRPESQAMLAVTIAIATAFLFYPFAIGLTFITVVMLALVSLSLWGDVKGTFNIEDNVLLSLSSSLGFIGGLVLVLAGIYFGASNYIADLRYAQAIQAEHVEAVADGVAAAISWNGHNDGYYRTGSQTVLGLLSRELAKKADPKDTQRTTRLQNYMASAVNLARTATELTPHEMLNWDNLGQVYQSLLGLVDGVDGLSESAYLKAAELRPGDASFHNKIGTMYLAKAQLLQRVAPGQNTRAINDSLDKAEKSFQKAIELSHNYGLAIYNLGVVYDAQGKLASAIKQLERVAPFNSDQPNLWFELSLLYYRNGNKDKAFNGFQNVLVLQPDFANAHWYLSLIYEERGDLSNATDQLKKILAIEANKDNETVLTRLYQLQSGKPTNPKGVDQRPL